VLDYGSVENKKGVVYMEWLITEKVWVLAIPIGAAVIYVGTIAYRWIAPWEGVVINKYAYMSGGRHGRHEEHYVVELYHNGREIKRELANYSQWISINIADYVVKKSWSYAIETRVIQVELAQVTVDILINRITYKDENIRLRAAEGLNRITQHARDATPELVKVLVLAVPALIEVLSNENRWARNYAAHVLVQIGELAKDIAPELKKVLRTKGFNIP